MASERRSNRRPSASQTRAARRARRDKRRKLVRYGAVAAIGAVAFLFIIALILPSLPVFSGPGGFGGGAPDGPGERIPSQGTTHVQPGDEHPPYNSTPPTSGWHYPQPLAPTRWGIHNEPLANEVLLHNLEHGGIGVFYDCPNGCPELVNQLSEIVQRGVDGGLKIIMAPYPGMDSRIALAAWTFLDKFDEFDEDRVTEFINAHESSPNSPEPRAR